MHVVKKATSAGKLPLNLTISNHDRRLSQLVGRPEKLGMGAIVFQ